MSSDGRFVVFESLAKNFMTSLSNGQPDVFVFDRQLKVLSRAAVTPSGQPVQWGASWPNISANGRYVTYRSQSPDIVAGDTNGVVDIFVFDRQTGLTRRASVSSDEDQANGECAESDVSDDGRYVCFRSYASNLVPNDTNGSDDLFVRDMVLGTTKRVSVDSNGQETGGSGYSPSITPDGRFVVFSSYASSLVIGDTNGTEDIFVHDCQTGVTTRESVSSFGIQSSGWSGAATISDDGRFVAFDSFGANLAAGDTNVDRDVFLRDRQTGKTRRISLSTTGGQANFQSFDPQISGDGGRVAFMSQATNLVAGDTDGNDDIYVKDLQTGVLSWASVSSAGVGANNHCMFPTINGNGQFVAFESSADNLVAGDTGVMDVFVHESEPPNSLASLTLNRSILAGQNRALGTVQMATTVGSGGATVLLSDSSPSITVPSSIVVPSGASSRTFAVSVLPVSVATIETISASYGSQSLQAMLTLTPLIPSAFEFSPSPVSGGSSISARLVLNGLPGAGGLVVALTDNSQFAQSPASVVVPEGAPQATFSILTLPVAATQYVTVTASTPQGSKTGNFVIRP